MPGNIHSATPSIIASWPDPDYNTNDRRSWLPALSYILLAFSTVLTAGRFYLRAKRQAGEYGLDDLFILIGWLASIGLTTCAVLASSMYGLDVHTWDVHPNQYVGAALTGWVAQVMFLGSTCATKTSVLLFYRRMVKDTFDPKWLYAVWAALGFNGGSFFGVFISLLLICTPLTAYWKSYDFHYAKEYTCINGNILSPLVGVLSIMSDVIAVVLPCVMLHYYDIQVPRGQKIGLNIIFALSTIVAGCGIARTYYLWQINNNVDTSWTAFNLFVWSLLECHLSIIFACAPSLRAFLRRYLGETWTVRNQGVNQNYQNNKRINDASYAPSIERKASVANIKQSTIEAVFNDEKEYASAYSKSRRRSETTRTIKNAAEYEAYAMRQLSQHGCKPSEVSEDFWRDLEAPTLRHDAENARSFMEESFVDPTMFKRILQRKLLP